MGELNLKAMEQTAFVNSLRSPSLKSSSTRKSHSGRPSAGTPGRSNRRRSLPKVGSFASARRVTPPVEQKIDRRASSQRKTLPEPPPFSLEVEVPPAVRQVAMSAEYVGCLMNGLTDLFMSRYNSKLEKAKKYGSADDADLIRRLQALDECKLLHRTTDITFSAVPQDTTKPPAPAPGPASEELPPLPRPRRQSSQEFTKSIASKLEELEELKHLSRFFKGEKGQSESKGVGQSFLSNSNNRAFIASDAKSVSIAASAQKKNILDGLNFSVVDDSGRKDEENLVDTPVQKEVDYLKGIPGEILKWAQMPKGEYTLSGRKSKSSESRSSASARKSPFHADSAARKRRYDELEREAKPLDKGKENECEVPVKVDSVEAPTKEAVSYTHLRAHETGRNLVCRLLLEKKKEPR
eukprot:TRINITY_DN2309_c0_g1_i3.p1 TRINITY_DN2309_c0_g1~~TRINITY_DN2309_c0_g1_i3.p1  ORF type:complete len:409 (-),score=88.83 TRINITY_DN2309_c0_g1_i3:29-1255(-)